MEIAFINSGIIAINLLASLKPGEIPGNAALISIFTGLKILRSSVRHILISFSKSFF